MPHSPGRQQWNSGPRHKWSSRDQEGQVEEGEGAGDPVGPQEAAARQQAGVAQPQLGMEGIREQEQGAEAAGAFFSAGR